MLFLLAICLQSPPPATPQAASPNTPAAPDHPAFAKAIGPHFEVEARFASQIAADQALAAAEWTVAPIESVFGATKPAIKPDSTADHAVLRHIVVYASQADFDAEWKARDEAHQKAEGTYGLCSGEPPPIPHPSVRDRKSHTSHVLVAPEFALQRLATIGLPMDTRRWIGTEAARLLIDETVADPDALAPWFAEGAAEWATEEGFTAAGWLHDRMDEPTFAQLTRFLPALEKMGLLPSLEGIVVGLPGGLTSAERPAVDGAVFRFLKDPVRAQLFARVALAARSFHESEGGDAGLRAALGDDAARSKLQDEFQRYVTSLRPKWIEILPAAWSSAGDWQQVATPDQNAILWRDEAVESDRYALEGELQIQPGPTQQMNVLVCKQDRDFVQVSFVAGYGIDVFSFRHDLPESERWMKIAAVEVNGLKIGTWTPFRLQVEGGTLSVTIAGKAACTAKIDAKMAHGTWGLGVLAGSAGRWRKIGFGQL